MLKCDATLLESHFGMSVLLKICCIFSEHFSLEHKGCFCIVLSAPALQKKPKRNDKRFNDCSYSLFFLMSICD